MLREEPTIGDKVLSFFKLAKTDYKGNERLSRAAGRLYNHFSKLFAEFSAQNRGGLTAEGVSGEVRYSLNEAFRREITEWFKTTTEEDRLKSGKRFLVGRTGEVLQSIGVPVTDIYFGGSKISKILRGNTSMTLDIVASAVELLENPILVMESQTVDGSLVLFGEVYTTGNKPVMISLLLNPATKTGEVLDYMVITSAYGRGANNLQNLIDRSRIYYVNENEKRTGTWLKALGLQLTSALTTYGSIDSITKNPPKSNSSGKKSSDLRYSLPDADDAAALATLAATEGSVGAKRAEYAPSRLKRVTDAAKRAYIETVNAQAGIEWYLRKHGVSRAEAETKMQITRASRSQSQAMIGGGQYDIFSDNPEYMGKGIMQILEPARAWSEDKQILFQQYLLHQLNIDRMTLEGRLAWQAAFYHGFFLFLPEKSRIPLTGAGRGYRMSVKNLTKGQVPHEKEMETPLWNGTMNFARGCVRSTAPVIPR